MTSSRGTHECIYGQTCAQLKIKWGDGWRDGSGVKNKVGKRHTEPH